MKKPIATVLIILLVASSTCAFAAPEDMKRPRSIEAPIALEI